jgi:hypothetical protein
MRTPLLVVLASLFLVPAASAGTRLSGVGFTLKTAAGWDNKSGDNLVVMKGKQARLSATIVADKDLAEAIQSAKTARDAKSCEALGVKIASSFDAKSPVSVRTKAGCETAAELSGNALLFVPFASGSTAILVTCLIAEAKMTAEHDECRAMARSLKLDPKAKPVPPASSKPR